MTLTMDQRQIEVSEILQGNVTKEMGANDVVGLIKDMVDGYDIYKNVFGDSKIAIYISSNTLTLTKHDEGLTDEKWIGQYSSWHRM